MPTGAEEPRAPPQCGVGRHNTRGCDRVPRARVGLLGLLGRTGLEVLTRGIGLVPVPGAGLKEAGASQVRLQCAPVDAAWHDPGAAALALAHARVQLAALLVGQMHAAAEYARRYALERVAFGRP